MIINSPPNINYPVKVIDLCKAKNAEVARFDTLLYYSFQARAEQSKVEGEWQNITKSYVGSFPSDIPGRLVRWKIAKGDILARSGIPIVEIEEPCRHEVQWGNLCTDCGLDMTGVAFTTVVKNTDRAPINMTHGNSALRVSSTEAGRVNESTMRRLLSSRKLSLVVDLDQTIIQATVDPTVGDWKKDPSNPNYEAVKDVQCFQLADEGPEAAKCWYYIKFRPGLIEFLDNISQLYELHVYTMGTRAYARNIVKLVDPNHEIFGDRILSRDESGSLTVKTLHRLFPTDTKMVAVIDDRGDVWNWSDNLVKVAPYEFFVGTADINAIFLPKQVGVHSRSARAALTFNDAPVDPKPTPTPSSKDTQSSTNTQSTESSGIASTNDSHQSTQTNTVPSSPSDSNTQATIGEQTEAPTEAPTENPNTTVEEQIVKIVGANNAEAQQEAAIAFQLSNRPLLRRQELLDKADDSDDTVPLSDGAAQNGTEDHDHHKHRRPLLHDDDTELFHLERHLRNVHTSFFDSFDWVKRDGSPSKVKASLVPDVADIISDTKVQVLDDVTIVFTGIIQLGLDVHSENITRWAESFGASVITSINRRVTHVIAAKGLHTDKVMVALATPGIHVVGVSWLYECFLKWERVDETPHLLYTDSKPQFSRRIGAIADALLSGSEVSHSHSESESDDSIVEDLAGNMTKDWDAIQAELDEFLDSDSEEEGNSSEDGEEDAEDAENDHSESDDGYQSDGEGPSTKVKINGTTIPTPVVNGNYSSPSKRKRLDDTDDNIPDDDKSDSKSDDTASGSSATNKRRALGKEVKLADGVLLKDAIAPFDEAALEAEIAAAIWDDLSDEEDQGDEEVEEEEEQVEDDNDELGEGSEIDEQEEGSEINEQEGGKEIEEQNADPSDADSVAEASTEAPAESSTGHISAPHSSGGDTS